MDFFLAVLFAPDVSRLGHPDWPTREATETVLRRAGVCGLPVVFAGLTHDDPEVRARCGRLAARWLSYAADLRAAAVLRDPWPPNAQAFWDDHELRRRCHRLAQANGCHKYDIEPLLPEWYTECGWLVSVMPVPRCLAALAECKRQIGTSPGWPFE